MQSAKGSFDVKVTPTEPAGQMKLDKRYHGPLDAEAQGTMMTAMTSTQGSAGYVAVEQVKGTLEGRRGSFTLQHSAMMERGVDRFLTVLIVPDSGTEELTGIAGELVITRADGKHFYELKYTLPA